MSVKEKNAQAAAANAVAAAGELSEAQLDAVAGGQEVKKMGTIVVEAKRLPADQQQVVKMETIVVTASRDKPDLAGSKVAAVNTKKN